MISTMFGRSRGAAAAEGENATAKDAKNSKEVIKTKSLYPPVSEIIVSVKAIVVLLGVLGDLAVQSS
jgi:hypothetical protein